MMTNVNIRYAAIVIDNCYEWTMNDPPVPPFNCAPISAKDIINLELFKAVYLIKFPDVKPLDIHLKWLQKWKSRKNVSELPGGSLVIPAAAVINDRLIKILLEGDTQSGGWDIWFDLESNYEILVKTLKNLGGKKLHLWSNDHVYMLSSANFINEINSWEIGDSFLLGFAHDLDNVYIYGQEEMVKTLYGMLPNEPM